MFQDKVVLVTGAAAGLGKLAAEAFAAQGAKIAISDVDVNGLNKAKEEFSTKGYEVYSAVCDVAQEDQVKAFVEGTVEAFGKLDIAVNNAGVEFEHAKLADVSTEAFTTTMNINTTGVFLCMKYQLKVMETQADGGVILNMSSVAGLGAAPFMGHYAASKHAVIGLTKTAAAEYGRQNIRVNAVCPFITHTEMFERVLALAPDRDEAIKALTKAAPMKRAATPDEVIQVILFACDPRNSFMTGAELKVDGGFTAV